MSLNIGRYSGQSVEMYVQDEKICTIKIYNHGAGQQMRLAIDALPNITIVRPDAKNKDKDKCGHNSQI
jgi:hypothetical protein